MGQKSALFTEWLLEEQVDLQEVLVFGGVTRILYDFETWLKKNDYIVKKRK